MKRIMLLAVLFSASFITPINGWNYGGKNDDFGYSVVKTEDGYIIAGKTSSYGAGGSDAWLIKVNENGEEIWNRTYGGEKGDTAYCVLKVEDGYIIAGKTSSYGAGGSDAWLIKVNENGEEIWNRTYGGKEDEDIEDILRVDDGYIFTGGCVSFGSPYGNVWVVKVDNNGKEIWNRTYGGKGHEIGYCIDRDGDGYIIAGTTTSFGKRGYDAWLIRIDSNGKEIWNRTYGGKDDDYASSVKRVEDGYIMVGSTFSYREGGDAWIRKVNENGDEVWNRTYGGRLLDGFNCVDKVEDGYVMVGGFNLFPDTGDGWIVKTDNDGNMLWNKTFGGEKNDYCWSFTDGYVIVGSTSSFGNGYDVWLVKVGEPKMTIDIYGGFGITILIKNYGDTDFSNIDWSIGFSGLVFSGTEKGTISFLPAGGEERIHIPLFGIGFTNMEIRVGEIYERASFLVIGAVVVKV